MDGSTSSSKRHSLLSTARVDKGLEGLGQSRYKSKALVDIQEGYYTSVHCNKTGDRVSGLRGSHNHRPRERLAESPTGSPRRCVEGPGVSVRHPILPRIPHLLTVARDFCPATTEIGMALPTDAAGELLLEEEIHTAKGLIG